jgi:hypothetical protein
VKLEVTKAHLYFNEGNTDEVGCQVDYRIKNIGNTPALQAGVVFRPLPHGHLINVDLDLELEQLRQAKPRTPRVLFPGDEVIEGLSMNFPYPPQPQESMVGFKVIVAIVYRSAPDGETHWTPAVLALQHETPPADRVYRFYRGMGTVPCIVMLEGELTPHPT